ncbi:MAG: helix-turn-helix domain-containing protein [Candidatus Binatales bacterium]
MAELGPRDLKAMIREMEGRLLNQALRQTAGNQQAAARLLGLKRTTFVARLKRCGVIAPPADTYVAPSKDDAEK